MHLHNSPRLSVCQLSLGSQTVLQHKLELGHAGHLRISDFMQPAAHVPCEAGRCTAMMDLHSFTGTGEQVSFLSLWLAMKGTGWMYDLAL